MSELNFFCPKCAIELLNVTKITAYYDDHDQTIPWECPTCKFKGEWQRERRKTSFIVRILQAIKRSCC